MDIVNFQRQLLSVSDGKGTRVIVKWEDKTVKVVGVRALNQ